MHTIKTIHDHNIQVKQADINSSLGRTCWNTHTHTHKRYIQVCDSRIKKHKPVLNTCRQHMCEHTHTQTNYMSLRKACIGIHDIYLNTINTEHERQLYNAYEYNQTNTHFCTTTEDRSVPRPLEGVHKDPNPLCDIWTSLPNLENVVREASSMCCVASIIPIAYNDFVYGSCIFLQPPMALRLYRPFKALYEAI